MHRIRWNTGKCPDMVVAVLGLLFALAAVTSALAEETGGSGQRQSVWAEYSLAPGERDKSPVLSEGSFSALQTEGTRASGKRSRNTSKPASASNGKPNTDFWFYTADVELFNDQDRDGFYYGIDILFDADTYFNAADVYAVLYLSLDGGPWNEFAATETFTIYGAIPDDDYVVVTELLSGYPTGSYDVAIDLFDAYDDAFLAFIGPDDTSELAFIPLEDAQRDKPVVGDTVVVVEGGGGGTGGLALLALVASALGRGVLARVQRLKAVLA